jgi:predicted molibdopterin-dependent oxidoreductase YjgC
MTLPNQFGHGAAAPDSPAIRLTYDGEPLCALEGQTIAAALLAAGHRAWRITSQRGEPRGLFCGMGVCFDCLVSVDGRPNVRACQTTVAEGMCVQTQRGPGLWEAGV